jgi:hypothetical protein
MPDLYDTSSEAAMHEQAIAALIEETRLPERIVRTAYEREFARLRPGARVKDYLLVFTIRRARDALRQARV